MKKTLRQLMIEHSGNTLTNASEECKFNDAFLWGTFRPIQTTYISHCDEEQCIWFDKVYMFKECDIERFFKCKIPEGTTQDYYYDEIDSIVDNAVEVYPHINTMERCDYLDHPQQ